jgi:hypothetical protein
MALAQIDAERLALDKFRQAVQDLNLDEGTLMRFLRARNLDLKLAEGMLRAHAKWRVDNVYLRTALAGWKPPKELMLHFKAYHCGHDLQGRTVFYIHLDSWLPTHELYKHFTQFDLMVFAYRTFLLLFEEIQGSPLQQLVAVIDAEGIGFRKMFQEFQAWTGVQTLIDVWQIYEANFPEVLHKAFFVNTARAFLWGFNLVKPFATKHTLSKIAIHGTDGEEVRAVLQAELPLNVLPCQFGGTGSQPRQVYDVVYDGAVSKLLNHPSS